MRKEKSSEHARYKRQRVYGVDFSAAAKAGNKIWLATGLAKGKTLRIEECWRVTGCLCSSANRDECLGALREFIATNREALFGIDFPFGLPKCFAKETSWQEFVRCFPRRYDNQETFYEATHIQARRREPKRLTDEECKTPFAPNNIRVYRQTYYGIRELLRPLALNRSASILPMIKPSPRIAWVVEICPASTLKRLDLYLPYKGSTLEKHQGRCQILEALEALGRLSVPGSLRAKILNDNQGDALDSVIAAYATFNAFRNPRGLIPSGSKSYRMEGYVYA